VNTWVFVVAGENAVASLAITRLEMSVDGTDRDHCELAESEWLASGEDTNTWPLNECRLLIALKNPGPRRTA